MKNRKKKNNHKPVEARRPALEAQGNGNGAEQAGEFQPDSANASQAGKKPFSIDDLTSDHLANKDAGFHRYGRNLNVLYATFDLGAGNQEEIRKSTGSPSKNDLTYIGIGIDIMPHTFEGRRTGHIELLYHFNTVYGGIVMPQILEHPYMAHLGPQTTILTMRGINLTPEHLDTIKEKLGFLDSIKRKDIYLLGNKTAVSGNPNVRDAVNIGPYFFSVLKMLYGIGKRQRG